MVAGGSTGDGGAGDGGVDDSVLWYAALGHLIDEVVFIHREDRRIAFVSPSVEHVLGYTPEEYTRLSTPEIIHPDDLPAAAEQAVALRSEPGTSYRSVLRIRHRDGHWIWAEIVGRNLLHEPSVEGVVQTLRDITERRALEDELRHRASHDGLTGLANRNHLLDLLDVALDEGPADEVVVAYLDLDGFKQVNDTHGHLVGDALLRVVADRLAGALRPGDAAGRLGGDELVAVCRGVGADDGPEQLGRRLLQAVAGPAVLDGVHVDVRTSVGVARGGPGTDADHLVSAADAALYAAKRAGGSQVRVGRT